jgi:hypothetical protein
LDPGRPPMQCAHWRWHPSQHVAHDGGGRDKALQRSHDPLSVPYGPLLRLVSRARWRIFGNYRRRVHPLAARHIYSAFESGSPEVRKSVKSCTVRSDNPCGGMRIPACMANTPHTGSQCRQASCSKQKCCLLWVTRIQPRCAAVNRCSSSPARSKPRARAVTAV